MKADTYTKIVLTVIAAGGWFLVVEMRQELGDMQVEMEKMQTVLDWFLKYFMNKD